MTPPESPRRLPPTIVHAALTCARLGAQDLAADVIKRTDHEGELARIQDGLSVRQALGSMPSRYVELRRDGADPDDAMMRAAIEVADRLSAAAWVEERDGRLGSALDYEEHLKDIAGAAARMSRALEANTTFQLVLRAVSVHKIGVDVVLGSVDGRAYATTISMLLCMFSAPADVGPMLARFAYTEADSVRHLVELGLMAHLPAAGTPVWLVNAGTLSTFAPVSPHVDKPLARWNGEGVERLREILEPRRWQLVPRPAGNKPCKWCARANVCDAADSERSNEVNGE